MKLFDTLVKPILLYASEAWEPFLDQATDKWDYNPIEKVHTQFLKHILGLNRSTTNILVRGETNRLSLQEDILRRNIKYTSYINSKDNSYIVKQAYNYELQRGEDSITFMNTIKKYSEALQELHSQFLPLKNPYENILRIPSEKLKLYTRQIFNTDWKTKLTASKKGETYRSFKDYMRYEPYLDNLSRKQRTVLLKLRVSDHKLMIEEGRRMKPKIPRENRLCKFCKDKIETEEHFLTECPLYGGRQKFFSDLTSEWPNFNTINNHQKFLFLMTQENFKITEELCNTINEWLSLRETVYTNFL